jgi:hypothetical protein
MDNHLARRERAALVTSQAQISQELAALQAKVEEVGQLDLSIPSASFLKLRLSSDLPTIIFLF